MDSDRIKLTFALRECRDVLADLIAAHGDVYDREGNPVECSCEACLKARDLLGRMIWAYGEPGVYPDADKPCP